MIIDQKCEDDIMSDEEYEIYSDNQYSLYKKSQNHS